MSRMWSLLACCVGVPTLLCAQAHLHPKDLVPFLGNWTGELAYLDYSSGEVVHIPATLLLESLDARSWRMGMGYTEEPHANELDTVVLAADGRTFDGHVVLEVTPLTGDSVRVVLEQQGDDDSLPAVMRRTWSAGPHRCTMQKEVRYTTPPAGRPTGWFVRHTYTFTR
jgi:hypothetical protein